MNESKLFSENAAADGLGNCRCCGALFSTGKPILPLLFPGFGIKIMGIAGEVKNI